MSSVLITGILKDAFGAPIPNYEFFFEAIRTSDTLLNTTNAKFTTSGTGSYSFTLEYGTYTLKAKPQRDPQFKTIASNILVYSQGLTNKDIQYLLTSQADLENIDQTLLEALLQVKADILNALTLRVVDKGNVSLASGIYPTPEVNGQGGYFSSLWYVTTGGTVSGVVFTAGDQLLYSATAAAYRKIDNTDLVSSVNGMVGTVVVTTITGNAGTATTLQTARTIGVSGDGTGTATSFNGSANITIPFTLATVATAGTYKSVTVDAKGRVTSGTNPTTLAGYGITDAQPLDAELTAFAGLSTNGIVVKTAAGTATTRSVAVSGAGLSVSNADGIAGNPTVISNATNLNTASTIVARDASGNFAAGTITAALSGNATTATTLATARSISITGDGTWTTSFNGGSNVTGTLTLATVATPGTYGSVTVDAKGRVISGTNPSAIDPSLLATKEEVVARIETTKAVTPATLNAVIPYSPNINPTLDLDFANQVYRHFEGPDGLVSHPLTPFVTFTRSSTATYFDAMGVMKQAAVDTPRIDYDPLTGECRGLLVEEQRTNLFPYSAYPAASSEAKWGNIIKCDVYPNVAVAPDGTMTAAKAVVSVGAATTGNDDTGVFATPSVTSSATHSLTLYVKDAGAGYLRIRESVNTGHTAKVNLTTGAITAEAGYTTATFTVTATDVGNGWWRVAVVRTPTTTFGFNLKPGIDVGDGVSGIYVWGAQVEAGSFPTSYIPTPAVFSARASSATYYDSNGVLKTAASGVARSAAYDYDADGVLRPIGLLLEGAATNLVTQSEFVNGTADAVPFGGLVTAASFSGLTSNTGLSFSYDGVTTSFAYKTPTLSALTTYAISVFVAMADGLAPVIKNGNANNIDNDFCLVIAGNAIQIASVQIKKAFGNTYRVSGVVTTNATVTSSNCGVVKYASNSSKAFTISGYQLEAGAYATSYIATTSAQATRAADISTSAQATRAADNASISGANFSQWYKQYEGTVVVEVNNQTTTTIDSSGYGRGCAVLSDGTDINRIRIGNDAGISFAIKKGGGDQTSQTVGVVSVGKHKGALSFATNNINAAVDAVSAIQDVSASIPYLTQLHIGKSTVTAGLGGTWSSHIRSLKYYPKALASAELQAMTA